MSLVCLSLGSNAEPEAHLSACLKALEQTFGDLRISRVFESEPVGVEAATNFYNAVVAFESSWPPGKLNAWVKALEAAHNQGTPARPHCPKALDIDLLAVGEICAHVDGITLPRDDIRRYAFVLRPLAELLPDQPHPDCRTPYKALFERADFQGQRLWPVEFYWRGARVSP
ncbi:2-amino-4-hydroxy-6-hydroxymethyldihydropteridine diphosphokinase [Vreelandella sp. EE22]